MVAIAAAAILSLLFVMSRSSDPETHARVVELLREIRSNEVVLSRLLLQISTGRLQTYDPLLTAGRNLGQSLIAVRREAVMQAPLQSLRLDRYAALAATRRDLIERFKSTDAVYRTSSVYLPILTREVMARLRTGGYGAIADAIANWDENLFLRLHGRLPEADFALITRQLQTLAGSDSTVRADIDLLSLHADVLGREQESARQLLDQVLDLSSGEILDEVYQAYMERHTAENRRAGYILCALYAVAFLCVLGLIVTIVKLSHLSGRLAGSNKLLSERAAELERLSSELRRHRENLEDEVADRTAELFDSEARLTDAIETLPDGFVLFDAEDRLVMCNAAFRALSVVYAEHAKPGITFDELIRRVAAEHGFHKDGGNTETWLQERINSHRAVSRHTVSTEQHQSADGRWIEVHERRMRDGGIVGLRIDVTEAHRRATTEREQDKLASLGQLAGGVAHEINNLLQPALTFADLMRDRLPADDVEGREDLELVLSSVRKAREIVRNILLYSRKQEVRLEPADLAEATGTALAFIRDLLPSTIALRSTIDWAGGRAAINKTQLTQVLTNLVVNAAHASSNHGTIEITTGWASPTPTEAEALGLMAGARYMTLAVADTGTGMEPATMARIFEPFFTTKPQGEGTGLGLSVVFGILRSWRGAIAVRSQIGVGTVFTLYIPLFEPALPVPVAA